MAQRLVALALLLVAGCGRLGFDPLDSPDDLVDPDAEGPLAIDYGRRWAVLARGGEIRALEPRVVGEAADFTVTPALPDGLAIDPTTGIIAGIAPELASSSTYTITAGGSLRSASFELVLDIRTAVEVDSTTDTGDLNPGDGICDSGLGDCTLRAAVEEANATGEPVVVTVPPGTYPLASQIQIRAEVAVVGAGTRQTVLDGQLMTRVLKSIDGGVAHISDLDIRRGAGTGGSALEVFNAVAHLSNVVVAQNIQGGDGGAGLKYTSNAVGTIEYSTIADNVGDGGGGGLNVNGSTVDIYRTRFVNNSAAGRGGGLSLFGDTALVTIDSSSFEDNHADVVGGAMASTYSASLVVSNSTFLGNTAAVNGAVANTSFETPSIELVHCTLVGTADVPAIDAGDGTQISLRNTILATDGATPCSGGGMVSAGFNLAAMDATSCALATSAGDLTEIDPLLAFSESSTLPVPAPTSPAVDALTADQCAAETDTNGLPRPLDADGDGDAACDIGAIEVYVPR